MSSRLPYLTFFSPRPELANEKGESCFTDWAAFLAATGPENAAPLGFYLRGFSGQALIDLLRDIRQSRWWALPVFAPEDSLPADAVWVDMLAAPGKAQETAQTMARLGQALPQAENLHLLDERLLHFLCERGTLAALEPVCDRLCHLLYRYPVAELLAQPGEDADKTLHALCRHGLLKAATVVDRTRHCRACGSAQLHFFDVCPQCGSIDIHQTPLLHCFACGHVAPETAFLAEGTLRCPNCRANLRHIGVDYDRPLAQYACRSCDKPFIESAVKVRCLECGQIDDPDALPTQEIATLVLTDRGRSAARAGEIQATFAALKNERYIEPDSFLRALDWMLTTQRRYADFRFSLLRLEFTNAEEMMALTGGPRLYMLLDEFAHRFLELLRASDLTTRTSETVLWMLLPYSTARGLAKRLRSLLDELADLRAGKRFQTAIRAIDVPGKVALPATWDAQALMCHLTEDERHAQ
ncbi:MAG: hypothetical protein LBL69_00445 [Zoogloeaceae bacterium]|nr:hypothetical protein [Zoogloeaceae bacterium]